MPLQKSHLHELFRELLNPLWDGGWIFLSTPKEASPDLSYFPLFTTLLYLE
jgi:hypothetical protein